MSISTQIEDKKQRVFRTIKPACVGLSESLLSLQTNRPNVELIERRLAELDEVLLSIADAHNPIDLQLADYVFFPISQLLKLSQQVSLRCLELSLRVIDQLVQNGWSTRIPRPLAQQLLILCTLLASDKPSIGTGKTTTELQRNAITCLQSLLLALKSLEQCFDIKDDTAMSQLGQMMVTTLEAHQNKAPGVQSSACLLLHTFVNFDRSGLVLRQFLPGIVSALTKVLARGGSIRTGHAEIRTSLVNLTLILKIVFGQVVLSNGNATEVFHKTQPGTLSSKSDPNQLAFEEQAAPQIRLALVNICRLQDHDRKDVKLALAELCMALLTDCRSTLAPCTDIAVETVLSLTVDGTDQDWSRIRYQLVMASSSEFPLHSVIQACLYKWSQSAVRLMQGADEEAKNKCLLRLQSAYRCLASANVDLTTANQLLSTTLKDCVLLTLQSSKQNRHPTADTITAIQLPAFDINTNQPQSFSSLAISTVQQSVLDNVQVNLELLCDHDEDNSIINSLLSSLTTSRDENLITGFWLLLQRLHNIVTKTSDMNFMIDTDGSVNEHIEDAYGFALSYLATSDQIPAMTSLSLQALALRAQSVGKDFRFELVDALYPVLHALATTNDVVQHDSIVALNVFTRTCAYASVKELIVDNVDYLTNAVALKLNAFDLSPQAPQVLLMMVKLAGPSLVPYLEDIVHSIFAALEDYHGYPLLVELLFKTLAVIADEGSKAPLLDARGSRPLLIMHQGVDMNQPTKIADLAERIRERAEAPSVDETSRREQAPHEPWTSEHQEEPQQDLEEVQPPAPKTYNTLTKITELTQHFLPSASPALRISLLALIQTTIPAIARHENTFLPLINTLWPEIVSRLGDDEPSIRAASLDIIAGFCQYAKDFMRSRVMELWPHLKSVWQEAISQIVQRPGRKTVDVGLHMNESTQLAVRHMKRSPEDYSNTSARLIWTTLIKLLSSIVETVPVPPEMFDEALQMVESELDEAEVLQAFQRVNADAVWLMRFQAGHIQLPSEPRSDLGFIHVARDMV